MNKLWLIIKHIQISENKSNAFFLKGGERIKLGRVLMKIVEVNSEMAQEEQLNQQNEEERSDSHNTQMSFGEVDAELDNNAAGVVDQNGNVANPRIDQPEDPEQHQFLINQ